MTDYNLTVSVKHEGIPPLLDVVQGDSGRNIVITVADMDITGCAARVYVVKPSGLDVYNNAAVVGDVILVELTAQMLAEVGNAKMQVSLYGEDDERVTTFNIWLNVEESLQDGGQINSSTEYKTLDELIDNAGAAIEDTTAATDEASKAASSANSAASSANTAASSATAAASSANTAAGKANTATTAANSAAQSASKAADAANAAAAAITYPVPIGGGGTGADNYKQALVNLHAAETTTEALTYYVDATSGSDNNDGLTAGTAFKTIQHAVDVLPKCLNYYTSIKIAQGTYEENVEIKGFYGIGELNISGRSNTTSTDVDTILNKIDVNVKSMLMKGNSTEIYVFRLNITGFCLDGITSITVSGSTNVRFSNVKIDSTTTTSGTNGIMAEKASNVYCYACLISNRGYALHSVYGSKITSIICRGSNNDIIYRSSYGGVNAIGNTNITGTTVSEKILGGLIINRDGTIG